MGVSSRDRTISQEQSKPSLPFDYSLAHFVLVLEAIVDRGDTGNLPDDVVQQLLDDMRRRPQRREIGRVGPPQVMQDPRRGAGQIIDQLFASAEPGVGPVLVAAGGKEVVGTVEA